MNLNSKSNGDSAGATSSSSGFKALAQPTKRPLEPSTNSSPTKKLKTSSFLNSYSWISKKKDPKIFTHGSYRSYMLFPRQFLQKSAVARGPEMDGWFDHELGLLMEEQNF